MEQLINQITQVVAPYLPRLVSALGHYCPAIAFGLDDNLFYFKDMNGF